MAAALGDSPASNIDESLRTSGHKRIKGENGARTFHVEVAEGGNDLLAWGLAESQGMRNGMVRGWPVHGVVLSSHNDVITSMKAACAC